MCAQLLSSASIITIITLVMERLRTVGVRPRTADDGPRCTGCTTFVPRTNRCKWYTCHVSQLTQGFPVYRHGNCAGTPFSESSINIRLCGVPGCTAKVIIRPSAEFPDEVLCN